MSTKLVEYLVYVPVSIALTMWVARTLYRNGRRFLVDVFRKDEELADSVNHLLVVGFYLISLGYIALALHQSGSPANPTDVVESLATKLGWVLLVLGGMHFFNLFVFTIMRSSQPRPSANLGYAIAPPPPSGPVAPPA